MPKGQIVPGTSVSTRPGNGHQVSRPTVFARPRRIDSIDLLRGLAIIVMALDHVRDFFTNVRFDPLDLSQTTPELFFARWITHFCAPVFVFLAGTSAFLYMSRGRTKSDLSRFLLSRGLWLVFLELSVVRFAWLFDLNYSFTLLLVIWAIGCSMIALSVMIFLPRGILAAVSIGMIALHNLADPFGPSSLGAFGWLWRILHDPGSIAWGDGNSLFVVYPLIPWIGVMGIGYLFGTILLQEEGVRYRKMYTLGFVLLAGFIFLRALNVYGDPHPWTVQDHHAKTLLSFLNTEKYPPSLLFLMMTLGPAIAILPFLERWEGKLADFIVVFGRVPLFFYVIHLYLIHLLALIAAKHSLGTFRFLISNFPPNGFPPSYGYSLPVIFVIWILVVFVLYFPCKWYARLKKKSGNPLLSYL